MANPVTNLDDTPKPQRRRADGKYATRIFAREDKAPHATRINAYGECRNCGASIPSREEGRQREFCDPLCRVRWHRRLRRSKTAEQARPSA